MAKKRSQTAVNADRWSYLWLLLGALLFIFGSGRWIIPFAVWLSPIFMLRFIRVQKPLWGLIAALIVVIIGNIIALDGVMPMMPLVVTIITAIIGGIFIMLPFVADRLISPRCRGLVSTLVYPLAHVTLA